MAPPRLNDPQPRPTPNTNPVPASTREAPAPARTPTGVGAYAVPDSRAMLEQNATATRPGLTNRAQGQLYDDWLASDAFYVNAQPWIDANPNVSMWLQSKFWTYRNDPDMMNALLYSKDLNIPGGGPDSGGGRGYGGGGGGGRSAAEQEAIDIENAKASIRNQAETLGIQFDDGAITALATTAVKGEWNQDRLTNYIVGAAGGGGWDRLKAGTLTKDVDSMRAMGNDNLLNISDETARGYAQRIATGELSMDTVQQILRDNAKNSYSWAAPAIDQGISVRDFLAPSRDVIANTLEMNPNDVNLMDPKWLGMLQTKDDKGVVRAATNYEIAQRARQDDSYRKTQSARDAFADIGGVLRQIFEGNV